RFHDRTGGTLFFQLWHLLGGGDIDFDAGVVHLDARALLLVAAGERRGGRSRVAIGRFLRQDRPAVREDALLVDAPSGRDAGNRGGGVAVGDPAVPANRQRAGPRRRPERIHRRRSPSQRNKPGADRRVRKRDR